MALPAAYAPISLGQIQGEFGGANPIFLSEYYRGAGYTTDNNITVPTGPAGVTIALSDFYSAWRAILVRMDYYRSAGNQNFFYLSAPGLPTVVITLGNEYGSDSSASLNSYIAPNVTYLVSSNTGNVIRGYEEDYSQPIYNEYGDFLGYATIPQNALWLEDAGDGDYNDLRWYPGAGTIYDGGPTGFYYILNY